MISTQVTPLISVVMPVFNAESYLTKAVNSILEQSYKNFELIIINDGSVDNTRMILETLVDSRVKIIHNKTNLGIVKSLNIGLENAHGDFIARMDADDLSHIDRFTLQIELMMGENLDICGCHWQSIDINDCHLKDLYCPLDQYSLVATLATTVPFAHGSVMMRSSFLKEHNLYYGPNSSSEDYKLWIDFYCNGAKFGSVNSFLYSHRMHQDSITSTLIKTQSESAKILRKKFVSTNLDHCKVSYRVLRKNFNFLTKMMKVHLLFMGYQIWRLDRREYIWACDFFKSTFRTKLHLIYRIWNS